MAYRLVNPLIRVGVLMNRLKRIVEIVDRISGGDTHKGPTSKENNQDNGATCGLAHTAFAFDEDPLYTSWPSMFYTVPSGNQVVRKQLKARLAKGSFVLVSGSLTK